MWLQGALFSSSTLQHSVSFLPFTFVISRRRCNASNVLLHCRITSCVCDGEAMAPQAEQLHHRRPLPCVER